MVAAGSRVLNMVVTLHLVAPRSVANMWEGRAALVLAVEMDQWLSGRRDSSLQIEGCLSSIEHI